MTKAQAILDQAVGGGDASGALPRLPVVIRPRPLMLAGLEELVATQSRFVRRLADRPEQLAAIVRVIWAHDDLARERFGEEAALLAYVQSLFGRAAA